ncbi:MAG: hypothetical protein WAM24_05215 [Ignavibacteriaceae bacterium]
MKDNFYTFALWKIKDNNEEEFLHIWERDFAPAFIKLNPYSTITLIQSLENHSIYYSFGPWINAEQMQSSRADKKYRVAISKLVSLCAEAKPGSFKNIFSISSDK